MASWLPRPDHPTYMRDCVLPNAPSPVPVPVAVPPRRRPPPHDAAQPDLTHVTVPVPVAAPAPDPIPIPVPIPVPVAAPVPIPVPVPVPVSVPVVPVPVPLAAHAQLALAAALAGAGAGGLARVAGRAGAVPAVKLGLAAFRKVMPGVCGALVTAQNEVEARKHKGKRAWLPSALRTQYPLTGCKEAKLSSQASCGAELVHAPQPAPTHSFTANKPRRSAVALATATTPIPAACLGPHSAQRNNRVPLLTPRDPTPTRPTTHRPHTRACPPDDHAAALLVHHQPAHALKVLAEQREGGEAVALEAEAPAHPGTTRTGRASSMSASLARNWRPGAWLPGRALCSGMRLAQVQHQHRPAGRLAQVCAVLKEAHC